MSGGNGTSSAAGYVACTIATVFFGSNYAVIRKYDTGDGMFVQWVMASAIFVVGLIVNVIRRFPKFYPLTMLGGFLWATGNTTSVPIIQMIGMALGILIWSSTNMFFGWASGRFGWFGVHPQVPSIVWLNYLGVAIATIASVAFVFVKTRDPHEEVNVYEVPFPDYDGSGRDDVDPLLEENDETLITEDSPPTYYATIGEKPDSKNIFSAMPRSLKAVVGVFLSLVAGIFYGLNFAPCIYVADNYPGASKNQLDYVFGHFTGVYITATTYFAIYSIATRNRPYIKRELFLPSFVCGLMWAIAQASWFIANDALSEAISFPIITRMPGVVASLWGVFLFKEIQGRRNYIILTLAILITLAGSIITGLS